MDLASLIGMLGARDDRWDNDLISWKHPSFIDVPQR